MKSERQLGYYDIQRDPETIMESLGENRHPLVLVLDRMENRRNLGMILRLADAARLEAVLILNGQIASDDKKVRRVARNGQNLVTVQKVASLQEARALYPDYNLWGLEITSASKPFYQTTLSGPTMLLVGNEKHGLASDLVESAEQCVHIPMMGMNSSMNVAMATGIAVYGLLEKSGWLQGYQD